MNDGSSLLTTRSQNSISSKWLLNLVAMYVTNQGIAYISDETPLSIKNELNLGSWY